MGYINKQDRNKALALWRDKNRQKIREQQREYYAKNKTVCVERTKQCVRNKQAEYNAKAKEWRDKNPEKVTEIRKTYYTNNTAKEIARVRQRQGRIKNCEIFMNPAELAEVQGMYDFCRLFKQFEVDHIIPLNGEIVSGLHVLANLQVMLKSKNRSKSNKYTIT